MFQKKKGHKQHVKGNNKLRKSNQAALFHSNMPYYAFETVNKASNISTFTKSVSISKE